MKRTSSILILTTLTTIARGAQDPAPYPSFQRQVFETCETAGWPLVPQCLPLIIAFGKIALTLGGPITQPATVALPPAPVVPPVPPAPATAAPSPSAGQTSN